MNVQQQAIFLDIRTLGSSATLQMFNLFRSPAVPWKIKSRCLISELAPRESDVASEQRPHVSTGFRYRPRFPRHFLNSLDFGVVIFDDFQCFWSCFFKVHDVVAKIHSFDGVRESHLRSQFTCTHVEHHSQIDLFLRWPHLPEWQNVASL